MYKHYGGRGVSVCEEWSGEAGVVNFCEWSMNNGYEEGLQIDRIDNDGNYEPSNCRWVTCQENLMNKSNTLFYEYNGNKKTLQDWAIVSNIPYKRLRARIKECGWSFEKAITTHAGIFRFRRMLRSGSRKFIFGSSSISYACK
jgi:hypothetical protein